MRWKQNLRKNSLLRLSILGLKLSFKKQFRGAGKSELGQHFPHRCWAAKQISLPGMAAELCQQGALFLGFYTFGDDTQVHAVGQ